MPKTLTITVETLLGFCANVVVMRLRVRAFLAPSNLPFLCNSLHKVGLFLPDFLVVATETSNTYSY